jgi:ferredoxin
MRVVADIEVCIGAGNCVHTAPKVFDQSAEDGTVRLLVDVVPDEDAAFVREAVDLCPSAALSIREED